MLERYELETSTSNRLVLEKENDAEYFELLSKLPHNTQIAYAQDINQFNAWCIANTPKRIDSDLANNKQILKSYFAYLIQSNIARATIERRKASLNKFLKMLDRANPFVDDELFKQWYKLELRSKSAYQEQAEPLTALLLKIINEKLSNNCPLALRNKLMLNIMFDGLLRANEVCQIQCHHLNLRNRSLFIPKSKTDQTGKGDFKLISTTTMNLIKLWQNNFNVKDKHLLRNLSPDKNVRSTGIQYRTVYNTFKELSSLVDIKKDFTAHSARVGGAVTMAENGCDILEIQRAGGWRTSIQPANYTQQVNLHNTGMGRIAEIIGR